MKKLNKLIVFLGLAMLFAGCKNNVAGANKTGFKISTNLTQRTVNPEVDVNDFTSISVEVFEGSSSVATREWNSYADAVKDCVEVPVGTYNAVLTAKAENIVYKGLVNNIKINKKATTVVNFIVSLVDMNFTEGTGNVYVLLTYPSEVAAVEGVLINNTTKEEVEDFSFEEVVPELKVREVSVEEGETTVGEVPVIAEAPATKHVLFENSEMPAGSYKIIYKFYSDENKTALVAQYAEVINVVEGLTSSVEREIKDLNATYTITYDLNGGSWAEGFTPVTKFSRLSDTIVLPTDGFKVFRSNSGINRWVDQNGETIKEIAKGTIGDITVSVEWRNLATGIKSDKDFLFFERIDSDPVQLNTDVTIEEGSSYSVVWSSSDTSVVTVDNTGLVIPVGKGTAVINAVVDNVISSTVAVVLDASDTLSYDQGTIVEGSDIYANPTDQRVGYYLRNDGYFDFRGRPDTSVSYMKTTFNNKGWIMNINGSEASNSGEPGVYYWSNGNGRALKLVLKPVIAYDSETNTSFMNLYYSLTNISTSILENCKFGSHADIMINTNDSASIYSTSYGSRMYTTYNNGAIAFDVYTTGGEDCTPVDTFWFGYFNERQSHLYDNAILKASVKNRDTGMAYSWQGITLRPGETVIKSVRMTLIPLDNDGYKQMLEDITALENEIAAGN